MINRLNCTETWLLFIYIYLAKNNVNWKRLYIVCNETYVQYIRTHIRCQLGNLAIEAGQIIENCVVQT